MRIAGGIYLRINTNYTYDALGQQASQVKGTAGMYLEYDISGKVTSIYSDAAKSVIMLSFAYDEGGNRIMKKDHRTNAVTWYSYNDAGTLMAVFESKNGGSLQLIEQPVYGSGRLGMLNRQGSSYSYTLTDHLGNTRAIINRNKLPGGFADVLYNADYYPYGLEARSAGIDTRYGYQGLYAEKDKETGWNSFELRNYDPAVGRWLTVDPMGQYISPYVGMGNNPVSMFDPSGGWSDGDPGKIAWRVKLDEVVVNARKSVFNSSFVKSLRNFQTNASAWAQRQSDITTQMSRTFAYVTQPSRDRIRGTLTPLYTIYGTMVSMGGGQAGYTRGWIGFAKGVEIIEDAINTVEEVKVIENVHSFAAKGGGRVFTQTEKDGDLLFYSTKIGDDIIEFGGNFSKSNGTLTIKNFDIDGALTNKLGIRGIKSVITDFGKQQGVNQVIIQGAKRTTGASPGKIPSQLIFKIN